MYIYTLNEMTVNTNLNENWVIHIQLTKKSAEVKWFTVDLTGTFRERLHDDPLEEISCTLLTCALGNMFIWCRAVCLVSSMESATQCSSGHRNRKQCLQNSDYIPRVVLNYLTLLFVFFLFFSSGMFMKFFFSFLLYDPNLNSQYESYLEYKGLNCSNHATEPIVFAEMMLLC